MSGWLIGSNDWISTSAIQHWLFHSAERWRASSFRIIQNSVQYKKKNLLEHYLPRLFLLSLFISFFLFFFLINFSFFLFTHKYFKLTIADAIYPFALNFPRITLKAPAIAFFCILAETNGRKCWRINEWIFHKFINKYWRTNNNIIAVYRVKQSLTISIKLENYMAFGYGITEPNEFIGYRGKLSLIVATDEFTLKCPESIRDVWSLSIQLIKWRWCAAASKQVEVNRKLDRIEVDCVRSTMRWTRPPVRRAQYCRCLELRELSRGRASCGCANESKHREAATNAMLLLLFLVATQILCTQRVWSRAIFMALGERLK